MPYYHVTYKPLNLDTPTARPNVKTKWFGKPVCLWYAEGDDWITVLDALEKERDRFLEERELSKDERGTRLKYEFPLEAETFVDDINTPALNTIFRLTSENIDAFEKAFEPYYLGNLYSNLKYNGGGRGYEITITNNGSAFEGDEEARVTKFMNDKGVDKKFYVRAAIQEFLVRELKKHKNKVIDVYVKPKHETIADLGKPKKTEKITLTDDLIGESLGFTEDISMFKKIRLIEYGNFLDEVMKPKWGGIDYDKSLFTKELKAKYPYIQYVEIPSGCLWHPKEVMPEYVPTPVQGGKRTRRRRRLTRRRRSRKQ
jgi:hypothetical protein